MAPCTAADVVCAPAPGPSVRRTPDVPSRPVTVLAALTDPPPVMVQVTWMPATGWPAAIEEFRHACLEVAPRPGSEEDPLFEGPRPA